MFFICKTEKVFGDLHAKKKKKNHKKTFHYFWEEIKMVVSLGMKMYIVQACIENALFWLFLFIYSILITTKIILLFHSTVKC